MAENEEGLAQHFRGGRQWWHFPVRVLRRRQPEFPTMPKRQPCPSCQKWCKRVRSVPAGAHYKCNCGYGSFIVLSRDTSHLPKAVKN